MTDKQIIIDGVDVSGCIYFFDGYCNDNNDGFKCSLNSEHCHYKNWKRKEQECERLKEEKAEILEKTGMVETLQGYTVKDIEYMQQQLDQLKAENNELKKNYFTVIQQRNKAEKTLTDIKGIAERDKEFCDKCDGDREIDCVDCHEGGRALLAQEILQKISECEGNDGK